LLKPDDAAFALVTMNRIILEEVMTELLRKVQHAMADFDESAARVQTGAGSLLASDVKGCGCDDPSRAGKRYRSGREAGP